MPVSMVGRAGELAELARAWSRLVGRESGRPVDRAGRAVDRAGRAGQTVVITGAGGVGKSLLIAAALDGLSPRPAAVFSGSARVHTPAPYDWLAAVLTGCDPDELPLPADALAWLAQHPNAPRERYAPDALLRLAVRTVRALVGTGPAVLVVEDLHALDPASLNLVGELAAVPGLPVLLVVASRPADAAVSPELTARTLARLCGVPGAVRQHLGPLAESEVAEVLAQVYPDLSVPPDVVAGVWQLTGGNPYRLTELLATRGGQGPGGPSGPSRRNRLVSAARPARDGAAHRRAPEPREPAAPPPVGSAPGRAELTGREIEVLTCLAAGMSNKQVARSLGISIRTVAVHVSNLLRKTGSASRTEAALWAVEHQFAGPSRRS